MTSGELQMMVVEHEVALETSFPEFYSRAGDHVRTLQKLRTAIEAAYLAEFAASLQGDAALKAREQKRDSLGPVGG